MSSVARRSWPEITERILTAALEGTTKTGVVYRANLSFGLARKYLDDLSRAGLLEKLERSPEIYKTTEEGQRWLKQFKTYIGLKRAVKREVP